MSFLSSVGFFCGGGRLFGGSSGYLLCLMYSISKQMIQYEIKAKIKYPIFNAQDAFANAAYFVI